jgi:hypothetical protein
MLKRFRKLKLEMELLGISTLIASLGKSRYYFECVRKDQNTADSLQQIRLKLIKQGEKEGVFKDYLVPHTICKKYTSIFREYQR